MSLKKWSTGKLMVLLAGLIIAAHQTIPHHHHYDFPFSHVTGNASDDCTHDESDDSPIHCHAFNESIVDDIHLTSFNFSFVPVIHFQFRETAESEPLVLYTAYLREFTNHIFPTIFYCLSPSPLRAPPVV